MKLNKKAIMLEFLVTVILALLIFTPACLFTSKLFRQSDQAQDSFLELVQEIRQLANKGKNGDVKTVLFIMDEETALVPFSKEEPQFVFSNYVQEPRQPGTVVVVEKEYNMPYPKQECGGIPCLCLCKEFTEEGNKLGTERVSLKDLSSIKDFQKIYKISSEKINYAEYMDVEKYSLSCKLLACQALPASLEMSSIYRFPVENRRVVLTLERHENSIKVKEQ